MFKIIGITGGVGSGKSRILGFLEEEYGAHIIMADEVGRRLMCPGTECFDNIVKSFGTEVLKSDGELDRSMLSRRIFNNEEERQLLNSIVHPAVKKEILEEIEALRQQNDKDCLIVIEAALLIEDHYDLICDELWYIYAPKELRIERLISSRGYTRSKCLSIMKNQLGDRAMRAACKAVINNSRDFEYTKKQLKKEYRRIMGEA